MVERHNLHRASGRLQKLTSYLAGDPQNLALLSDAAEAALDENQPAVARELLQRYEVLAALPEKERSLAGLAAMRDNAFDVAALQFRALLATNPGEPSLRFNLAWSLAMLKEFNESLQLLDPATVARLPQAAMLHVQLLHDQGNFEQAADCARRYIEQHPDDEGLLAAVSVLAIDIEDRTLAEACALRAPSQPDALVTLGTLALSDADQKQAFQLFSRALERNSRSARAWVGKGLAQLSTGDAATAAADIEHGAELFGEHLGSWIAAGWAHVLAQDIAKARACFDKAMALDHNFSEAHGSLAVIDVMQGHVESAKRSAEKAMRLDSNSFSGALAFALLMQASGNAERAREIVRRALDTPIDASGRTLARAIAMQGLTPSKE